MKKFTIKSLLIIALAIVPMTFFGQEETTPSNNWYIGVEWGATQFFGDNTPFKMNKTSWDADLSVGYTFMNTIYMYGNLGFVNLKGESDKFTIDKLNLLQANINFGYDVLQLFNLKPDRLIGIVPHIGYGMMMHKSQVTRANGTVVKVGYKDSNPGSGLNGRRFVFQIPMGVNFVFDIAEYFQANIDFVAVKTDTEGMDISQTGKHSDWYAYANVGFAYKFGRKEVKSCPECPGVDEICADAIQQAVEEALKDCQQAPEEEVVEEVIEEVVEEEVVEEVVEEDEVLLKDFEEKDIHLQFKVGTAEVIETQANVDEVKKLTDDMDAGREINKIITRGHASPEGNQEQNDQLAADRAKATAEYIEKHLGYKAEGIEFDAKGRGSDWKGFYKALEESDIAAKDEIREEIRHSENPSATLNQMKAQYPELEKILKPLRVVRVYINKQDQQD